MKELLITLLILAIPVTASAATANEVEGYESTVSRAGDAQVIIQQNDIDAAIPELRQNPISDDPTTLRKPDNRQHLTKERIAKEKNKAQLRKEQSTSNKVTPTQPSEPVYPTPTVNNIK